MLDLSKVIAYSKARCSKESQGLCATYVKKAFVAGGLTYVSGNGWNNQEWCKKNNFELLGDFVPEDHSPRAHNGKPIQFPEGYVQQAGDVCLIQHGKYGHICYAMSGSINDWVSDFFQKPPVTMAGSGPYCYKDSITRVQFWRHSSLMNTPPEAETTVEDNYVTIGGNTNVTTVNNGEDTKSNTMYKSKDVFGNGNQQVKNSKKSEGMVLGTHIVQS